MLPQGCHRVATSFISVVGFVYLRNAPCCPEDILLDDALAEQFQDEPFDVQSISPKSIRLFFPAFSVYGLEANIGPTIDRDVATWGVLAPETI